MLYTPHLQALLVKQRGNPAREKLLGLFIDRRSCLALSTRIAE